MAIPGGEPKEDKKDVQVEKFADPADVAEELAPDSALDEEAGLAESQEVETSETVAQLEEQAAKEFEAQPDTVHTRTPENDAKWRKMGMSWDEKKGQYGHGYKDFLRGQKEEVKDMEKTTGSGAWNHFQHGVARLIKDTFFGREKHND